MIRDREPLSTPPGQQASRVQRRCTQELASGGWVALQTVGTGWRIRARHSCPETRLGPTGLRRLQGLSPRPPFSQVGNRVQRG